MNAHKAKILLGIGIFVSTVGVSAVYLPYYSDKNAFSGPSKIAPSIGIADRSNGSSNSIDSNNNSNSNSNSSGGITKKNPNSMWKNMDLKIKEGGSNDELEGDSAVNSNLLNSNLIDDMMSLYQTIEANKVLIFAVPDCPYCDEAKAILQQLGHVAKVVYVNEKQRMALYELTSSPQYPNIWLNGRYVGGCNDGPESWMGIKNIVAAGKLKDYLK